MTKKITKLSWKIKINAARVICYTEYHEKDVITVHDVIFDVNIMDCPVSVTLRIIRKHYKNS